MQIPIKIAFHGIDKSDAVEPRVHERAEKLEDYFDRITGCRVVFERTIAALHPQCQRPMVQRVHHP